MNIKEIKEVLQLMKEHELSEIELEKDGLKLRLRKGPGGQIVTEQVSAPVTLPVASRAPAAAPAAPLNAAAPAEDQSIKVVKSPMVGTFYAAPAPDQPVFASVNQAVKKGDVLCIIEAMKLMNEIKSEMAGTIVEVLVSNGQAVEFDQPLFKIKVA